MPHKCEKGAKGEDGMKAGRGCKTEKENERERGERSGAEER